jgi:hypothetical protein
MIATTWEGAAADLADDLRIATTSLAKDGKGMCQSKSSGYSDCVSNPFRQFMREPWNSANSVGHDIENGQLQVRHIRIMRRSAYYLMEMHVITP